MVRNRKAGCVHVELAVALVLLAAVALAGCIENPAVKAQIAEAMGRARQAAAASKAFADEAARLRDEFRALRESARVGTVTPEQAAEKAGMLTRLLLEAQANARTAAREAQAAYEQARAIHRQHGVPWHKIAGEVLTTLVASYGGWGALAGAAFGIWRLLREKKYQAASREAIGVLTDALESTGSNSPQKRTVQKAQNPLVEEVVRGKQSVWEARKAGGLGV